ncbi:MAG TPA: S8 family serine peptidase, partial [Blastocatellia bacterium]
MFRSLITAISIVIVFFAAFIASTPTASSHSDQGSTGSLSRKPYRSQTTIHKAIVYKNHPEAEQSLLALGGAVSEDYGSFKLLAVPDSAADAIVEKNESGMVLRDDLNLILLRAGTIDTAEFNAAARTVRPQPDGGPDSTSNSSDTGERLMLVQMAGPIRPEWVDWLKSKAEVIAYIPNDTYLVRTSQDGFPANSPAIGDSQPFIQWTGLYRPEFKIAPEVRLNSKGPIAVTVQLATTATTQEDIRAISALSQSMIGTPSKVLRFTNIKVMVETGNISEIAQMPDVVWIEPWAEPRLMDERQDQLVANNYSAGQLDAPDYLAWLQGFGLATAPSFIIDVADSGIDQGNLDPAVIHKAFLNPAGVTRVAYAEYESGSGQTGSVNDETGHGTLNASIAGGYDNDSSFPDTDSDGYRFGLGVAPFAQLGVTKIFDPTFLNPDIPT